MKYFRPILNYGIPLVIADALAFRASNKPVNRVLTNEIVARFIIKESEYYKDPSEPNYLKLNYKAFLPHKLIELSVFRISRIYEKLIWKMGQKVAKSRKKVLIGRGDISVGQIVGTRPKENQFAKRLNVVAAPLPLSHANIVGYPSASELPIQKAAQRLFALELAIKATKIIKVPA